MDSIVVLSPTERNELFVETAAKKGISPAVVEKDFWVTWALSRLFSSGALSDIILFKGGTSLSKVFGLIERFSEDIDLILDWNELNIENPYIKRSKAKQDQFNKSIPEISRRFIEDSIFPEVQNLLKRICDVSIEPDCPDVINIRYPASVSEDYLRPEIRLEIGPLAMWVPNDKYEIQPYVADIFPDLFDKPACSVRAIKAERTFWEKTTILHCEAHRPESKPLPMRYSRHYYDVAMIAKDSDIRESALERLDLLHSVVEFKKRFYPRGWARYDLAKPGSLQLLPAEHHIKALRKDYKDMEVMFFGDYPAFQDLLQKITELEDEINSLI